MDAMCSFLSVISKIACLEKPSYYGWKPLIFKECIKVNCFMSKKLDVNTE